MEADPDAFECETCPVREWQARLDSADREALRIYRLLARPGVKELRLDGLVWEALGWSGTRGEAMDLIERLALLAEYDLRRAREAQAASEGDS